MRVFANRFVARQAMPRRLFSAGSAANKVSFTFLLPDGKRVPATGETGDSILDVAHKYKVDLEGACESSLACSTCHVILPKEFYSKLPKPHEEEEDMLDMAMGLTKTSRLGCQVKLAPELEGMDVQIPDATRNMQRVTDR